MCEKNLFFQFCGQCNFLEHEVLHFLENKFFGGGLPPKTRAALPKAAMVLAWVSV